MMVMSLCGIISVWWLVWVCVLSLCVVFLLLFKIDCFKCLMIYYFLVCLFSGLCVCWS